MKVFVYGTLKRGFSNHRVLGESKYLKDAVLVTPYRMYHAGFPVILPDDGTPKAKPITGEVYELPDGPEGKEVLHDLDCLEGEGRMYDRVQGLTTDGDTVSYYVGCPNWERSATRMPLCDSAGGKYVYWQSRG